MKDKIGGSLQSVTVLQHASPVLDMRYTTKNVIFVRTSTIRSNVADPGSKNSGSASKN
jgi:hypothetical protein